MQITMKREVLFLGQMRKPGEVVEFEIGNGVGQVTDRALRGLINGGTAEADGMSAEGGAMNGHLKARSDAQGEAIKKLTSQVAVALQSNDDLAARVAKLEAGEKPATSRRQARAANKE